MERARTKTGYEDNRKTTRWGTEPAPPPRICSHLPDDVKSGKEPQASCIEPSRLEGVADGVDPATEQHDARTPAKLQISLNGIENSQRTVLNRKLNHVESAHRHHGNLPPPLTKRDGLKMHLDGAPLRSPQNPELDPGTLLKRPPYSSHGLRAHHPGTMAGWAQRCQTTDSIAAGSPSY